MTTYRTPNNKNKFLQTDKRWAYEPYPTSTYPFKWNGCGCCAVTHCVIERAKYKNYTPSTVRKYMVQYATKGHGTEWIGIRRGLEHYGFKDVKALDSMSVLFSELRKGGIGVLLMVNKQAPDGTRWTSGGHYIAIVGYKESNGKHYFYIKDSASKTKKRNGWKCYETSLRGCIRKIWTGQFPDEIDLPARGYWQLGDKSNEIKKIQAFLKSKGFYKGIIGGGYRAKTEKAVKDFQTKYHLKVDGRWGAECNRKYEELR